MILLIDNYDPYMSAFYRYITEEYSWVDVIRNDEKTAEEIISLRPEALIIGSGAGTVQDTGVCREVIMQCLGRIPVLGVGLGSEILGECIGLSFKDMPCPSGKMYNIGFDKDCSLFRLVTDILPCMCNIARAVNTDSLQDDVKITVRDEYGRNIGFACEEKKAYGIPVYPAFIGAEGKRILYNFISLINN